MAPGIISDSRDHSVASPTEPDNGRISNPQPLKLSGALEKFSYEDTTPAIGREFSNVDIVEDLLNAADVDELLRDLAITSNSSLPLPFSQL